MVTYGQGSTLPSSYSQNNVAAGCEERKKSQFYKQQKSKFYKSKHNSYQSDEEKEIFADGTVSNRIQKEN
jgi:hypothetical protein